MLTEARRLRERLQQHDATTAVPYEALYAQLPRESAGELFQALGDAAIERSILFRSTPGGAAPAPENGAALRVDTTPVPPSANAAHTTAEADDSPTARACRVISQFMWRAPKYNEKYASQELSLLYQIFRLGGGGCDLVIDIGAGNANLSCLIALVFDVPVICVEMES